jgi:truncated hemoglobin YjbI
MANPDKPQSGSSSPRGIRHAPTLEQMLAFRAVSAEEKLRWLESVRQTLDQALPPAKKAVFQKMRRGEL